METYVNSAGKALTAAQVEQEYRRQLVVAGKPLEGDDYDRGLQDWTSTYRKLTKGDKRSITAAVTTGSIGMGIAFLIALVALIAGGGLITFAVILLLGALLSFGAAALVIIFTSAKPS